MRKRKNYEEVLAELKSIHKDWDFSLFRVYNGDNDKIQVICHEKDYAGREHGVFEIRISDIKKGKGCPKCKGKKFTSEDRKLFCTIKWNGKYDYSKSDFTRVKEKTTIICPIHGEFQSDFDHHFNAEIGCPYCSYPSRDTNSFIKEAKRMHNGFYSYDSVNYVDAHTKIKIICPIHGEFEQTPNAHLNGQGCPKCANNRIKLEETIENILSNRGISFIRNKRPKWLKTSVKGQLSLDFYIPEINLGIECQGKQHFGIGGWSESFDFEIQYRRDEWKKQKCDENGVNLVYFANENEAPNEYLGKIFTSESELMDYIEYLYKNIE